MADEQPDAGLAAERLIPGDGATGCLLIHGLTGTPAEMAPLAATLQGRHPLWIVRVAGHATTVADLAETSWLDWYESAATGLRALSTVTPRSVVIGLSMGALLALHLAIERPGSVAAVALLSPAVTLGRGTVQRLSRFLRALGALDARSATLRARLARVLIAKHGSDIADEQVRAHHPGYRQIPLRALLNLLMLQRVVRREAPRVTQPALVVHALHDHTCPIAAARELYTSLGSREKRLVLLEESFHVVTVDRERATVCAEVRRFVEERAELPLRWSTMPPSPS
ncbi:MAG: alpha/beta fold hydrolase [Deltaproteobacteria bacterium]|nr:alpha/beta fold hydrolase [Deltaproteobacteria bacterium]